jgi:hypothetical protein
VTLGIRKNGRYNHLIKLLVENKIKYNPKEIMELSTQQMTRRIIELGGKMRIEPRQRAGEERFGKRRCSKCDFTCQSNNQLIKHQIEVHHAKYSINKLKEMHFWSKYHHKPLNDISSKLQSRGGFEN